MQNSKCGKPQWFCPCDCACCETHPRKLRKITNTNHGNREHDKTRCGDPPHKHKLATLRHLKVPTKTNHCHVWRGNSVLRKTRCCKQGCKRSCKRGCKRSCKRTMLATKNNAGNQTHSAATLFSATCSAPHTSSSRSSNLSPPQNFQS